MKRRITACFLMVVLCIALVLATSAQGGSSSDPVVSKSYVDGTFFESVIAAARAKAESSVSSFKNKYISAANNAVSVPSGETALVEKTADAVLSQLQSRGRYLYSTRAMTPKSLRSGDKLSAKNGTIVMMLDGSAKCASGSVINLTQGREVGAGNALGRFTTFMFPENGAVFEVTSKTARVLVDGVYSLAGYDVKYMDEAYALKSLGLVRGAADGMELYRGNTRAESITMLIRLLGEEAMSLSGTHKHPFGDVDAWAQNYVGYAYRMGYTKGVTEKRYDGSALTTANQYMTFVLRSLGYSEEAGDFAYLTAVADAVRLGVIPQSTANELNANEFRRDHVMHISYLAMSARIKGSEMTLLARLVANGAVASAAANDFLTR
ncbi:MAG: hypothetical protein IJ299_06230 [Oscillospiraceae bacterium]|nr:hypothetical protein [Oscillospiraceae bacterium]